MLLTKSKPRKENVERDKLRKIAEEQKDEMNLMEDENCRFEREA